MLHHGFLLLDKDIGLNSFKLVVALRKLLNQRRVGYAGTLDPLASGLMVMAFGEYTKLLPCLEKEDKTYVVEALLGKISDTYDSDGEIREYVLSSSEQYLKIPEKLEILSVLNSTFTGEIMQIPPRYSAIQIGGERAYSLARRGEDFELKARSVSIYDIKILDYNYPRLHLEIRCSGGTYIRSLVHDLGQSLKCGGIVEKLRRISVGCLSMDNQKLQNKIKKLVQLNSTNLKNNFVSPRLIFADKFQINLNDKEYESLSHGNFILNRFKKTFIFSESYCKNKNLSMAIAFWSGKPVGIIEPVDGENLLEVENLKFARKLNLFNL